LLLFGRDVDGLVGGVGEQAFFVGVDGVEEAFAAEVAVFDDGEAAAVERLAGGVGDPEGAQGLRGGGAVGGDEGDAVGGDFGLERGDEGGLVFADGDGVGEVVGEEVVEGGGFGVGDEGFGGGFFVGEGGSGAVDFDGFCGVAHARATGDSTHDTMY
jgi:fibronectin-binding autotransporter adhesin